MSTTRLDWKFLVGLLVALAGVIVPVLLWQFDLSSKELTVKLESSTNLSPTGLANEDRVQITVAGNHVDKPTLSTIEIKSTGSRPISTADYEAPLKVSVAPPSKLVSARLARTDPLGLPAKIRVESNVILLEPLLLNPNDTLKVVVVTADGIPTFEPTARIAGIRNVGFTDSTSKLTLWVRVPILLVIGALAMNLYLYHIVLWFHRRRLDYSSFVAAQVALSGSVLVALCGIQVFKAYGLEYTILNSMGYVFINGLLVSPFALAKHRELRLRPINTS
jgi:hypothetical protein